MAATVKAILQGASLDVANTQGIMTLRYYIDGISGLGTSKNMELARNASGLPRIGTQWPGGPIVGNISGFAQTHTMWCLRHHVTPPGRNGLKWFVDVEFRSPPAPTLEFATGLVQRKSDLYLVDATYEIIGPGGVDPAKARLPKYAQIQISYYRNANNAQNLPPQILPRKPGQAVRYFYSDSFRVNVTRYGDIDYGRAIQQTFNGCINATPFQGYPPRTVLCTGVQLVSEDGGWSYRLIPEFLYNLDSWDPIVTMTNNGEPVLLSDAAIAKVLPYLKSAAGVNPIITPQPALAAGDNNKVGSGGAGRFPLYPAWDFGVVIPELVTATKYRPFTQLPSIFN